MLAHGRVLMLCPSVGRRGAMNDMACTDPRTACQGLDACALVHCPRQESSSRHCTEPQSIRPHLLPLGLISPKDPFPRLVFVLRLPVHLQFPFTFASSFESFPLRPRHLHLPTTAPSILDRRTSLLPQHIRSSSSSDGSHKLP
jgi:hypothetical protein